MPSIFNAALLLSVSAIVFAASSCSPGNVSCGCYNNNDPFHSYDLGKKIPADEAANRCSSIQNQYQWDTCLVMEPK